MTFSTTSVFDLRDHLTAKSDPALIAHDDAHFAAVAETMAQTVADLSDRLEVARRAPAGTGQAALDRDQEVHRLAARLRTLRRFGLDLCLGHMVSADDPEPLYVGRLGRRLQDHLWTPPGRPSRTQSDIMSIIGVMGTTVRLHPGPPAGHEDGRARTTRPSISNV